MIAESAAQAAAGGGGMGAPALAGVAASQPRPMPVRKANLEDFVLIKTVGKGSFGKVVMVRMGNREGAEQKEGAVAGAGAQCSAARGRAPEVYARARADVCGPP